MAHRGGVSPSDQLTCTSHGQTCIGLYPRKVRHDQTSKGRPLSHLTRKRLAANLADSLSLCAWDDRAIAECLRRRLPVTLRHFVTYQTQAIMDALPGFVAPPQAQIKAVLQDCSIFARVHRYCEKHNIWPAPDLSRPRFQPIAPFVHLNIPPIATLTDLADWLALTPAQLDQYADATGRHETHGDMAVNHYHYHLHAKASGGQRLIEAPKPRLKSLQRVILRAILNHVPTHPDAFGFIAGKSCLHGAARHVGEPMVVAFDLRDFFANISAGRVFGLLRALGYPPNVAGRLTGLCTNITPARVRDRMAFADRQMLRRGHLPQGAPTSPALANLVAYQLDCRLSALAKSLGASYTRYADDMTFSGDPHIKRAVLDAVPQIVRETGFALNPAKTRVMPSQTRQVVTGIVVNAKTNVDRRDYDRLKAAIHARPWEQDPAVYAQIIGQIGWVTQLNPAKGTRLRELLAGQGADA